MMLYLLTLKLQLLLSVSTILWKCIYDKELKHNVLLTLTLDEDEGQFHSSVAAITLRKDLSVYVA